MKVLLTSAGITNSSIAHALVGLLTKKPAEVKVGFIPTAANVEGGNKDWFLRQFKRLEDFGFTWIDIIDISAPSVDWQTRLAEVDIIFVSGGNTFHLLDQMRKTGFDIWLQQNLDNKVYVGISAGSIVATPTIAIASIDNGDVNLCGVQDLTGLSLVTFEVSPHTPENVSHEANKEYLKTTTHDLYAFDDNSAILVNGDQIEVISEGEWIKY